jgi:hypothetical protein
VRAPVGSNVQDVPPPKQLVLNVRGPLDERDLDRIARLQLFARGLGVSIALHDPCGRVGDLIALCGLSDVLPVVDDSAVEVERQPEAREQVGIDEEVDRGDHPV